VLSRGERQELVTWVTELQARSGLDPAAILSRLDVSPRTFRRWQEAQPVEAVRRGRPPAAPPTPEEVRAVTQFARQHPFLGYKRLAWRIVDQGVAFLAPYQVGRILGQHELLRRAPRGKLGDLRRPAPPERPDQVWHIDLMYLRVGDRWFYLTDIVDGYSRYLVHWSLNATMLSETVTQTVQEALETVTTPRRPGEPQFVHDRGSQFVSAEWKRYMTAVGCRDIPTRVAHPQSNGRVERLHRTHREEGFVGAVLEDYRAAVTAMAQWARYYNEERPHSAIEYFPPRVYYRGNPAVLRERRQARMEQAIAAREAYWKSQAP
jgi:putative transposase